MEKICALILIFHAISWVHADSHSLRYYYTAVSAPGSGLPEFSIVGYMDDQQTELYDGDIRECVPVATWVKKERPEQWVRKTLNGKEHEAFFRHEIKIIMKQFNYTKGFHFVQLMHSCELRDDGSSVSDAQFRYDGREYMYLDIGTGLFISTMAEAQMTMQRWNSPDVREGERIMNFLSNECIERLKRYVAHDREDVKRRVRPRVKVTGWESGEITKLHCQVYGFHPRAVHVKWMKNEDDVPSYETTHVLPNPDGTYQIRVSAEVIPKEGDSYSCYVDHSSLEEPLLVKWEPKQDSPPAVIISVVIIVVLTAVIAVIIIYIKKKNSYTAANTSDAPADTSNEVAAEL